MKPKILDDFEFRVRKVDLSKNTKKSYSHSYIENNISNYNYRTFISKTYSDRYTTGSKVIPKFSVKPINKNQHVKNTEVVIKLTSNSKNFKSICNHIDYITRNGELDFFVPVDEYTREHISYRNSLDRGELVEAEFSKNAHHEIKTMFVDCKNKKNDKEQRETFNLMFSMKDYLGVDRFSFDPQIVRQAAIKTIETMYPNNFFVAALHTDTSNPHCHICLKAKNSKTNKYIDIRKNDFIKMRKIFADELKLRGVEATATYKKDRYNKNYEISRSSYDRDFTSDNKRLGIDDDFVPLNRRNPRKIACEKGFFEIVDFGTKKFKPDDKKESFFITYQTEDYKPITIWGKDLERLVKENNLAKGSFAKFQKLGTFYEPVKRFSHLQDNLIEITDYLANTKWDCITFDKNSKTTNKAKFDEKLPKVTKPKSTSQFIKKLNKDEYDGRPNKLRGQPKYTREQWARYNRAKIQRDPTICVANSIAAIANKPRNITEFSNDLRSVSAVNLDATQPSRNQLFLSSNAQPNISAQKSNDNKQLRPANQSDRADVIRTAEPEPKLKQNSYKSRFDDLDYKPKKDDYER